MPLRLTRAVKHQPKAEITPTSAKLFAVLFGVLLGVAFLKFCTPSVMERFIEAPTNRFDWSQETLIQWALLTWPIHVAYPLIAVVVVAGFFAIRWMKPAPGWLITMPAAWLLWQFIAGTQSLNPGLTQAVLSHFAVCVVCLYLGLLCLNRGETTGKFLWPVLIAFGVMLAIGLDQHFGGLQNTRDYFWTYIYPTNSAVPPELIKKMQSNRIFSTVFYPNSFAGALLLLSPVLLAWIWQAKERLTFGARSFVCGIIAATAAACLYWTGSKGGWLLALLIVMVALLHQSFSRKQKILLVVGLLVAGGAGFYLKNRAYIERGAASVTARFDYWQAAWQNTVKRPIFGSGPGTFGEVYQSVKRPESEMARLTHNDYLQQASDSGFPGLIFYAAIVGGVLCVTYRRLNWHESPLACGVWLGLLAWTTQSAFEFVLYVPALSWSAFALMGWLLANTRETIRQPTPAPSKLAAR
jgi:O-antigen ligase